MDASNILPLSTSSTTALHPVRSTVQVTTTTTRRVWVAFCWACTWWIPSSALSIIGRMKRPDVQQAWREKVVLCFLIALLSFFIIFYIVLFGKLLCPQFDRVWNSQQVAEHQGDNDFWVSMLGNVYDLSDFWLNQHSDVPQYIQTTRDNMSPFGGKDLTDLFPVPLNWGCAGLVGNELFLLEPNNTVDDPTAVHKPGAQSQWVTSAMHQDSWYWSEFLVKMETMRKGDLVWAPDDIINEYNQNQRKWVIYGQQVFDLTNYFHNADDLHPGTQSPGTLAAGVQNYHFLDPGLEQIIRDNFAKDITAKVDALNSSVKYTNLYCLNRAFYAGILDFRLTPRCQANNYLMLVFSIILMAVNVVKFLAALRYSKRGRPEPMDKFVICQVPCYTEGEDSIRKTVNSLTALEYDDKAKLLFVICDGMVVGSGNDRPTPRIVLDVLGVDPKLDPEPLMFKSVAEGSKQLNYAKVYSGLYEFEGHVVPYIVVIKVGKPSERTRPGNRGKRDSQIILMQYLNRIHFDSEMCPLELEICHHQRNVIGIDPSLYEFILMVDADTEVASDSLNRLVADSSDDAKIIGICGETSISNDERSVWTMIQVYEYYISHHLSKSFESLFGSVTCLPGCFCMYRIRIADEGRPLIISSRVIEEYSEGNVDTLHKKNLLSLGEDRYLTTLMMKHFPLYRLTFNPHAMAKTAAPDSLSVLLSQRRRWINSTVHNLAELAFLPELCGFCCFSMRFVVIIDLLGTLILPATVGYLVYLIVMLATHQSIFPLISIIMLAAIYGLQALIFILKLQWQHVGWMVIYLLSFPFYSLFIPIYSFWHFDDFSWGNTRVVIGEKGNTKMVLTTEDDDKFDESVIPLRRWSDYEQDMWEDEGSQATRTTFTDYTYATGQTGYTGHTGYTGYTGYTGHTGYAQETCPWTGTPQPLHVSLGIPPMSMRGSVYSDAGASGIAPGGSVYSGHYPYTSAPYIPPLQHISSGHSPLQQMSPAYNPAGMMHPMNSPGMSSMHLMNPRTQTPPAHYSPYMTTQPMPGPPAGSSLSSPSPSGYSSHSQSPRLQERYTHPEKQE